MPSTFPYTPTYTFGEETGYAVAVNRFEDTSEQRQLVSVQQGRMLTYQWAWVSSSDLTGIQSFFVANNGPGTDINVVDHRTGELLLARFADPQLDAQRTAPQQFTAQVRFQVVQSGGIFAPLLTVSRGTFGPCFTLSLTAPNTPGFPSEPQTPIVPSSLGDTATFLQASVYPAEAWYIAGDWFGNDESVTIMIVDRQLFGIPFVIAVSATMTGVAARVNGALTTSGWLRVGVYASGSQSYPMTQPESLVFDGSTIAMFATNTTYVASAHLTLGPGMYYAAMAFSRAGAAGGNAQFLEITPEMARRGPMGATSAYNLATSFPGYKPKELVASWDTNAGGLPATFPQSFTLDTVTAPRVGIRFGV